MAGTCPPATRTRVTIAKLAGPPAMVSSAAPAAGGKQAAPFCSVARRMLVVFSRSNKSDTKEAAAEQLAISRLDLANVPVWVTEDNVNADYDNNGMSNCNPGQTFVADKRGTSAFFAA
jgi:hypothetical protein